MVVTQCGCETHGARLHTEVSAEIYHEGEAADLCFSVVFDGRILYIAPTYIPGAPEQLVATPVEIQSHHMLEYRRPGPEAWLVM